jgi:hypothetical protein
MAAQYRTGAMSKKTRNRAGRAGTAAAADSTASASAGPNPRQPCPCGSGKRYKACHGAGDDVIVLRPFEGLASECDLVAMREFVPSGYAPLPLSAEGKKLAGDRTSVRIASVLPGASAAMVREDTSVLVGMQTQTRTGDLSGDLARALRWSFTAEPGEALPVSGASLGDGPVRLQDLLDPEATLDVTVAKDFAWRMPPGPDGSPGQPPAEMAAALEHANNAIMPTEAVRGTDDSLRGAYWVDAGEKAHLRWVRPEQEDRLLAALARLSAANELSLGDGSKYVGAFRAHGLLIPVWDLDREMHVKEWNAPVEALGTRLNDTLAALDEKPLTDAERRARDAITGRQVTLR